jgi:transmembrane sensor
MASTLARSPLGLKAAAAAVCAVAIVFAVWTGSHEKPAIMVYETAAGERTTVRLPDHSQITLNSKTIVAIRFTHSARQIELRRGEALFNVVHDSARPFQVLAKGVSAESLGTQYDVDVRSSGVTIAVLEGAVLVTNVRPSPADGTQLLRSRLDSGYALRVPRAGPVVSQLIDVNQVTNWTRGQIEFVDTPLSEVVEDINRYYAKEVSIGSSELLEMRVGGLFRTEDPSGYLTMLRDTLRIDTRESGNSIILVSRPKQ